MDRARLTVNVNGVAVHWHGVDAGALQVHARIGPFLIVKALGHKYWSRVGESRYAPARFWVFKLETWAGIEPPDGTSAWYEQIVDFPITKEG